VPLGNCAKPPLPSTVGAACLTRPGSRLYAHVVLVEEGLQIAHECFLVSGASM